MKPQDNPKKLMTVDDVASKLDSCKTNINKERNLGRFPKPLIWNKWSEAQIEDYISQLEAYGYWDENRYMLAMESRRGTLAGRI